MAPSRVHVSVTFPFILLTLAAAAMSALILLRTGTKPYPLLPTTSAVDGNTKLLKLPSVDGYSPVSHRNWTRQLGLSKQRNKTSVNFHNNHNVNSSQINNNTESVDLTSLFASSSPGDVSENLENHNDDDMNPSMTDDNEESQDLTLLPSSSSGNPESDNDDDLIKDGAESLDPTSLFSSSSPSDFLEDAEIAELFNKGGMWTNNRQLKKKLKPHRRRFVRNGMVTSKMYKPFSKVVFVLFILFIIVGLVTNAMALKVFRGLGKNVTNVYMICLCCFDVGYLVFLTCAIVATVVVRLITLPRSVRGRFLWLYDFTQFCIFSTRQV
ncbi:hypothetical protein ACOMHN_054611 [Nucella lapillus]